jgi:hypothetical protein
MMRNVHVGQQRGTMVHCNRLLPALLTIMMVAGAVNPPEAKAATKTAADLVMLLEKSGHEYSKVDDNVWKIMFQGKNMKSFSVHLTIAGGVLVTLAKLADRKSVKLDPALLTKMLELNNDFDYVKLALNDNMLYIRMDSPLRVLDVEELNHVLEQVSAAADEAYPQISPFVEPPKE